MKAELPIPELVTIKGGGHMALMEHNQPFAKLSERFVLPARKSA